MKNIDTLKKQISILCYFFSPSVLVLTFLIFLTIVYGLIEMTTVGAILPVLDAGIEGVTLQKSGIGGILNIRILYLKIGAALGFNYLIISSIVLMTLTFFSFVYKAFYAYFSQRVLVFLWVYHQRRIYSILSKAKYSFYADENQGKIIYNSAIASESIAAVIDSLTRGISEAIRAVFLIVLLFISSWIFTLAVVFIGTIYLMFSKGIIRKLVNIPSMEILHLKQRQHKNLNEFITGIKLIKVFNKTGFWMNQYMDMAKRNAELLIKTQIGALLPSYIIQLVIGVGIGLVGIYIGTQPNNTVIRLIPLLGLFIVAFSKINDSISIAIGYLAAVARHFPNLIACHELLHKTPVSLSERRLKKKFSFEKKICFSNVSFSYNGLENIVSKVSFIIPKNNTVALIGVSGCGKTTILNLILRLFETQEGSILIDGVDIRSMDIDSYYQAIGFVSQEPFLFNETIFENVAFGSNASLEEVKSACKRADADEFIENLNLGYESIVGDSGIKLSGGQKQRIGIARALLKKPQLLILDEPTSALDNESERRIQKTLDKLSHSLTVLVVAHRLSTIRSADKIIVLKDGRIVEEGIHRDLIALNKHYYQLYH